MKKNYLKIAAILNLGTAVLHLIGGQIDLVNPLLESKLSNQQKAEWIGVWHMVSILLFFTSYFLLKIGFGKNVLNQNVLLRAIAYFYIAAGVPFIINSFYFNLLAPQFILLIPIGILILFGIRKQKLF